MKVHNIKIKPQYFIDVLTQKKQFELRKNDRDYHVGDILSLEEYDKDYTGNFFHVEVVYMIDDETYLQKGYVALGIKLRLDMGACLNARYK